VFGGEQHRPLLSVRDATAVIARAALKIISWRPGIYNVASDNLTVQQIAHSVMDVTDATLITRQMNSEDRRSYKVDSSKIFNFGEVRFYGTVYGSVMDIKQLIESGRLKNLEHPYYYNTRRT
jgi:nucleoside-diphosphate-sugar epimerase